MRCLCIVYTNTKGIRSIKPDLKFVTIINKQSFATCVLPRSFGPSGSYPTFKMGAASFSEENYTFVPKYSANSCINY
jgi:hypothetical protein